MFKSGTYGENEYGVNPLGKIVAIPFKENPFLAVISKIEENKNSAWITTGIVLILYVIPNLALSSMNQNSRYAKNTPPPINSQNTNYELPPILTPAKEKSRVKNVVPAQIRNNENSRAALEVLISFHRNITDRNFSQAYNCLSWDFQDYISYNGWIEGFDTTLSSSVDKIRVVSASENFVVLLYVLTAVDRINGNIQTAQFDGQAVFIKENGFWKIDEIKNKPR